VTPGSVTHADGHRVQVRLDPETLCPTPLSDEAMTAARQLMMSQA
jgi:acyl-CoA thioester hydrolase